MRGAGLRPLGAALEEAARRASPATTLVRVQACWEAVVGGAVAAEASPSGEREGVITVSCRSSVWAQELELLGPDLLSRLNAAVSPAGEEAPIHRLRFVTRSARPPG